MRKPMSTIRPNDMNPSYRYYNMFFIPMIAPAFIGLGFWTAPFIFLFAFGLHSLIDSTLFKYNLERKIWIPRSNPKHKNYDLPLILAGPVLLVVTICAIIYPYQTWGEVIGSAAVVGVSGGIMGLSAGHELIHRGKKWQRNLGLFCLYCINYPYFAIEHMWHHKHLATELDSDVAKYGETIYGFLLRSIPYGWKVCWISEAEKLKRRNKSLITLDNRMLKLTLIQVILIALVGALFGLKAVIVFMLSGLVSISILKWADYIEHYGIERKVIDGKREPITRKHSWDCVNYLSNFTLMNLGHHSHHHHIASVHYPYLEASPENSNTLPHGYTTLMILALFPKRWNQYMNPFLKLNGHI